MTDRLDLRERTAMHRCDRDEPPASDALFIPLVLELEAPLLQIADGDVGGHTGFQRPNLFWERVDLCRRQRDALDDLSDRRKPPPGLLPALPQLGRHRGEEWESGIPEG